MAMVDAFQPDHRFLYKPIEGCLPSGGGCHLDLWVAKSEKPTPLAIFIHGGALAVGSTLDIGFNQVRYFLDHGVSVASIEYRLIPHATHLQIRDDQIDAYIWIQEDLDAKLAEVTGSERQVIDTTRCMAIGASAGGTSALYLALDIQTHIQSNQNSANPLNPLRCIISAYPTTDPNDSIRRAQPKEHLENSLRDDPEKLALIRQIYDQPVCVSEPYIPDVLGPPPSDAIRWNWYIQGAKTGTLFAFRYNQSPPFPPAFTFTHPLRTYLNNPQPLTPPVYPATYLHCALQDDVAPPSHTRNLKSLMVEYGVECVLKETEAPHGFMDLPSRYFADRIEGWWEEAILPSLDWARMRLVE